MSLSRIPFLPDAAAVIADGPELPMPLLRALCRGRFVIALDGAATRLKHDARLPDLVMGDFDAIGRPTLRALQRRGVPCLRTPDQNFSDLEKAISWCIEQGFRSIRILQAFGDRIDHSWCALSLLRKFHHPARELLLQNHTEHARYLPSGSYFLRTTRGQRIALLPFPECRVHSQGLRFELRGERLLLGQRESSSNSCRGKRLKLQVSGGALFCWEQRPRKTARIVSKTTQPGERRVSYSTVKSRKLARRIKPKHATNR